MLRERRVTPVRSIPEDPSLGNPLKAQQEAFVEWTRVVGLAEQTALIRRSALTHFIRWCDGRLILHVGQITGDCLEQYQRDLYRYRKKNGQPLAVSTQVSRLNPLKAFCKWLAKTRQVPFNPAAELIVPSVPRRLPGRVLTDREIERVLEQPDLGTPSGVRDRAILELRSRARTWIERYLRQVRERLVGSRSSAALFLTDYGEPFVKNRLGDLVKRYISNARLPVPGACHPFRHACATHMLENGADIRYIQAMLGHADLSTTQVYTRVSIEKLREVHMKTHPASR